MPDEEKPGPGEDFQMDVGVPDQVLEFGLLRSGIAGQHRDQGPHFAHQIFQLQSEVKTPLKALFDVIDVSILSLYLSVMCPYLGL